MGSRSDALYQPLLGDRAVRFIKLLPGTHQSQICVELVCASLATKPAPIYEATSYTWGNPTPTRVILCNCFAFGLGDNAYDCLQQLRLPEQSRLLWMDCISINQDNMAERAQQVSIMHEIYRNAKQVIVWLGKADDSSAVAMEFAARIDTESLLRENTIHEFRGSDAGKSYIFDTVLPNHTTSSDVVDSLASLLSRPWFRRVWVQQEAAVCRNTVVLCGEDSVPLDAMLAVAWYLIPKHSRGWPQPWTDVFFTEVEPSLLALRRLHRNRNAQFERPNPDLDELHKLFHSLRYPATEAEEKARALALQGMATEWQHLDCDQARLFASRDFETSIQSLRYGIGEVEGRFWTGEMPARSSLIARFIDLVGFGSWLEATDPRDKVYALYNLVTSLETIQAGRPKVDYTIPWQVLYVQTAKWMYSLHAKETLMLCGRSRQDGVCIPSWVPDLRTKIDPAFIPHTSWSAGGVAYLPYIRFVSLPSRQPCQRPVPTYTHIDAKGKRRSTTRDAMEVTAIMVDRITYSGPRLIMAGERLVANFPEVSTQLAANLACVDEYLSRYFTGESGRDAYAGTIVANTDHEDKLATAEYERSGFAEWEFWLENGMPDPEPLYQKALCTTNSFAENPFVVTGHGFMCLAPAMASQGDFVAILNGFRDPVALRKVGLENCQYYELLGPCYIHRMMRGRAWNLIEEYKAKYIPGSESEVEDGVVLSPDPVEDAVDEGMCGSFPFNRNSDYRHVVRVLGKRRIALV